MSESGSDKPRRESIDFFEARLKGHSEVSAFDKINEYLYVVDRSNGGPITVYLTDLYTVGITDYDDIRERHPGVDCIVTVSIWNGYTRQAKEQAVSDYVGLFVLREFLGALNVRKFWTYVEKDNKGEPVRHWH